MTLRIHTDGDTLTIQIHSKTGTAQDFARLLREAGAPPDQAGYLGQMLFAAYRLGVSVVTIGEPS